MLKNIRIDSSLDSELNSAIIGLSCDNSPIYASYLIIKLFHQQIKDDNFFDEKISDNDNIATFEEAYCSLLLLKDYVRKHHFSLKPKFCDDYYFLKYVFETVEVGADCEFEEIEDINIHITPRECAIDYYGLN